MNPGFMPTSCVTLGKSFNFCVAQFHLQNGDSKPLSLKALRRASLYYHRVKVVGEFGTGCWKETVGDGVSGGLYSSLRKGEAGRSGRRDHLRLAQRAVLGQCPSTRGRLGEGGRKLEGWPGEAGGPRPPVTGCPARAGPSSSPRPQRSPQATPKIWRPCPPALYPAPQEPGVPADL